MAYNPVCAFAEGVNNNGTHLLKFRRGAFASLLPVRPCFIVVKKFGIITPTYDVMRFFDLLCFLIASCTFYHAKLHILPPFVPNDYLYNEHAGKQGEEKWETYAWALRDLLCKMGGWKKLDQPVREKLLF